MPDKASQRVDLHEDVKPQREDARIAAMLERVEEALSSGDEELMRDVLHETRPAFLLGHLETGLKLQSAMKRRDFDEENIRNLAYAAKDAATIVGQAEQALAEAAPTRIEPLFSFALPTGQDRCPCCKRPWPEGFVPDLTGFDEPEVRPE